MRRFVIRLSGLAAALMLLAGGAAADEAAKPSGLTFELTPYVWLAAIDIKADAQQRSGTTVSTSLSIPVSEYLTKLNFVGMLAASARYERFALHTDFMYLNANADTTRVQGVKTGLLRLPVTDTISASTRIQSTIWTIAGGYSVAAERWGTIEILGGVRMLALDQDVNYLLSRDVMAPNGSIALNRAGSMSASGTFWNGIVGIRGRIWFGASDFYAPFQFDIGSGAAVWSWQAFAGLGYRTPWGDVSVGYRRLSFQNHGTGVLQKLSMGGPIMTATFTF